MLSCPLVIGSIHPRPRAALPPARTGELLPPLSYRSSYDEHLASDGRHSPRRIVVNPRFAIRLPPPLPNDHQVTQSAHHYHHHRTTPIVRSGPEYIQYRHLTHHAASEVWTLRRESEWRVSTLCGSIPSPSAYETNGMYEWFVLQDANFSSNGRLCKCRMVMSPRMLSCLIYTIKPSPTPHSAKVSQSD